MIDSWRERAACQGADPDLFGPPSREERKADREERVFYVQNRYCAQCPVIDKCLQFGTANGHGGVWGGKLLDTNEEETVGPYPTCGTVVGYWRHISVHEEACGSCEIAHETALANGTDLKPCGTFSAYRRHLRYGAPPCLACRKAEAERVSRAGMVRRSHHRQTPRPLCGKLGGAADHKAHHERLCDACRDFQLQQQGALACPA